ncbi:MAG: ABC transporter substrate-binding protein [Chloroflexi bacterium]|nr:ABC transporter substrate-binding protein [Chloroflexota bacterium]
MKGTAYKYLIRVIVLVIILALTFGCAAAPAQPEKTKVTLRITYFGDASGSYASSTGPAMDGVLDFVKWSNETNYIPGVTLDIKMYDHAMDISRAAAMSKEAFTGTPKPVLSNGGQALLFNALIKQSGEKYKIPVIDSGSFSGLFNPPGWYFGCQPSYEGQLGAYADWVMANWKPDSDISWIRDHYQNRPPRMTIVMYDGQPAEQKTMCYVKSLGIEFNVEKVALTASDVTPQLTRMKGNTDFVAEWLMPPTWIACLKKAKDLGMEDPFVAVGHTAMNMMEVAKVLPDQANNNGSLSIGVRFFDEFPQQIKDAQLARKYSKDTVTYMAGWYWGDVIAQVIRKTASGVGVEKINGEACYQTLCDGAIKDFTPLGGTTSITWINNTSMVKLDGSDKVRLDLIEGWDGKSMDTLPQSLKKWYLNVPALMPPNGKDIPASCK